MAAEVGGRMVLWRSGKVNRPQVQLETIAKPNSPGYTIRRLAARARPSPVEVAEVWRTVAEVDTAQSAWEAIKGEFVTVQDDLDIIHPGVLVQDAVVQGRTRLGLYVGRDFAGGGGSVVLTDAWLVTVSLVLLVTDGGA